MNRILVLVLIASCFAAGCASKEEEKQIQKLQKLAVLKVEATAIAGKKEGTDRLLLRARGEAYLSVNLGKIAYEPQTLQYTDGRWADGQTLTITLPLPAVENPGIKGKIQTLVENRSIWTSADTFEKEVTDTVEKELQRQIQRAAEDPELIKFAKRRSETLIKSFYNMSHPGVSIVIKWDESTEKVK